MPWIESKYISYYHLSVVLRNIIRKYVYIFVYIIYLEPILELPVKVARTPLLVT